MIETALDTLDDTLDTYEQRAKEIHGWLSPAAATVCGLVLQHQNDNEHRGGILEIGAMEGRSAALWMHFLHPNEPLHLVEWNARPELARNMDRIAEETGRQYLLRDQNSLTLSAGDFAETHRGKLRFVHIDGDHRAPGVWHDLAFCAPLVHPEGVIVMDDFFAPRFPQITEVAFDYLRCRQHELSVVCVGMNKGLIVKAGSHDEWHEVLSRQLGSAFDRREIPHQMFDGTLLNRSCVCLTG